MVDMTTTLPSTMIGFDRLFDEIENKLNHRHTPLFPKHNVIKHSDYEYTIQLAVAGCTEDDLTIECKDSHLYVTGEKRNDADTNYLHKGITTKDFSRTFRLAEYTVVDGADLEHGILSIHLRVELPEEKKPRTIPIGKTTKRKMLKG